MPWRSLIISATSFFLTLIRLTLRRFHQSEMSEALLGNNRERYNGEEAQCHLSSETRKKDSKLNFFDLPLEVEAFISRLMLNLPD